MEPIRTKVGTILDGDNRFLGRSVFHDWSFRLRSASDAILVALGVTPTDDHREAWRLMSLCLISPDARVWPLKLTRLLASWGNPLLGYFAGQLVTTSRVMGPGAGTGAGVCLQWIADRVGGAPTDADVGEAVAAWRAEHPGPLGGFGVPFREVDERRAALLQLVGDGPLAQGRFWKLHLQLVPQVAARPNCVISIAALLLDIGVAAERCGFAIAVLMPPVFMANALEAARTDGARLHQWPDDLVHYVGAPARRVGDGRRAAVPPALQRIPLEPWEISTDESGRARSSPR